MLSHQPSTLNKASQTRYSHSNISIFYNFFREYDNYPVYSQINYLRFQLASTVQ